MKTPVPPISGREAWKCLWISASASLFLFLVFTWPLAAFWSRGIPSSAQNIETPAWRSSIPGDHLQLLYHFDLVSDMLRGETPWMHNIYEFNTGDDAGRYRPGAYFFPMSVVYAGLKSVAGQAAAWNISLWISVWLSAFFSWLWLRRFSSERLPLLFGILLILLVPSRWISLLGGSPAGFALMYVPLYAWCMDLAVRKPSYRSGFGAGACLLLLMWADLQTFYFTAVTTPVFLLISLTAAGETVFKHWKLRLKILPGLCLFLALIAWFYLWRKQHLTGSAMEHGRTIEELAIYSPFKRSFFIPGPGKEGKVYFGWGILTTLLTAGGVALFRIRRRLRLIRLPALLWVSLLTGMLFCAMLAVGVHGPFEHLPLRAARAVLPYYDMIRQPAKIMLVFPLWIGWLLCMLWSASWTGKLQRLKLPLLWGGLLWSGWELTSYSSATICLLPEETAAYKPAGNHHLMVVPLWPGDSSDTSVPMILAQQTRIPLVNGYSPVVSRDYLQEVVRPLESINMGWITPEQVKRLDEMKVSHLVVHENMFPEKVSPFPIVQTLRRLDADPLTGKVLQQGSVHTYKLNLSGTGGGKETVEGLGFPARVWRFDPETGCSAEYKMPPSSRQRLWLRVRGQGIVTLQPKLEGEDLIPLVFNVDSEDWTWKSFPFPELPRFGRLQLCRSFAKEGAELERALILEGEWPEIPLKEELRLPAVEFFHAGHVTEDGSSVRLRRSHEPDSIVFYGPRMPLGRGTFQAELLFDLPSRPVSGTLLGEFRVRVEGQPDSDWVAVVSGKPARRVFTSESNLPVDFQFRFSRERDLILKEVVFSPVPEENR